MRDFELTLEFKLVGGNSGVQFRSRAAADWQVAGPQADIEDGPNWTGCFYDQDGLGVVARRGQLVVLADGAPAQTIDIDDGAALLAKVHTHDWNDYTIRCEGKRIQLWINGNQTVDYTEPDAKIEQTGLLHVLDPHISIPRFARSSAVNLQTNELASRANWRLC